MASTSPGRRPSFRRSPTSAAAPPAGAGAGTAPVNVAGGIDRQT